MTEKMHKQQMQHFKTYYFKPAEESLVHCRTDHELLDAAYDISGENRYNKVVLFRDTRSESKVDIKSFFVTLGTTVSTSSGTLQNGPLISIADLPLLIFDVHKDILDRFSSDFMNKLTKWHIERIWPGKEHADCFIAMARQNGAEYCSFIHRGIVDGEQVYTSTASSCLSVSKQILYRKSRNKTMTTVVKYAAVSPDMVHKSSRPHRGFMFTGFEPNEKEYDYDLVM